MAVAGCDRWLGTHTGKKGYSGVLFGQLALSHNVELLREGLVLEPQLQHLAHSCCNAVLHDKHMACIRVWNARISELGGTGKQQVIASFVMSLATLYSGLSRNKGL